MIGVCFSPRASFAKPSRGLTLVELSVSIAISALLILMFLDARVKDVRKAEILSEASWVSAVVDEAAKGLANAPNFAGVSASYLASLNTIPEPFTRHDYSANPNGEWKIYNGSGGRLYVGSKTYLDTGVGVQQESKVNQVLALTYTNIPSDVCSDLIVGFASSAMGRRAPLSAIIGSREILTDIPTLKWNLGAGVLLPNSDKEVIIKGSTDVDFDVAQLGKFCGAGDSLKSVTLLRFRSR